MAGQDIKKRIEAGGVTHINVGGDYLFLKFADRPVNVIITGGPSGGSRVTMEAGDKYRPGQFQAFEVENPDPDNPAQIVFTVGTGDYNRQIVQGEISVEPILRNADGSTKTDTRSTLAIAIMAENLDTTAYQTGDKIAAKSYLIPGASVVGEHSANRPIVFAGPGGYPVFSWYYNNRADGGYYQTDWNLKKIDESNLNLVTALPIKVSSMSDNGWTPDHGYIGALDRRLYRYTGATTTEKVEIYYSAIPDIYSCCYVPLHNSILMMDFGNDTIEEIDATTLQRKRLVTGLNLFQGKLRWDWAENRLYIVGADVYPLNYETLAVGAAISAAPYYGSGAVIRGNNIYGTFGAAADLIEAEKAVIYDYVTKPEFIGTRPGCELQAVMAMPEALPQITADLTVTELATGIEISGEVIKAAMEYYFRRQVPDDYLDHIYFADLGKDRFGVPIKQIATGNATFDRANINDNFAIMVPGQISLIVDNELTLGAPL